MLDDKTPQHNLAALVEKWATSTSNLRYEGAYERLVREASRSQDSIRELAARLDSFSKKHASSFDRLIEQLDSVAQRMPAPSVVEQRLTEFQKRMQGTVARLKAFEDGRASVAILRALEQQTELTDRFAELSTRLIEKNPVALQNASAFWRFIESSAHVAEMDLGRSEAAQNPNAESKNGAPPDDMARVPTVLDPDGGASTIVADVVEGDGRLAPGRSDAIASTLGIDWFDGLSPLTRLFLLYLIIAILPVLLENLIDRWMANDDVAERRNLSQQIQEIAGQDGLSAMRCVRASTLNVRSEPSRSGTVVGSVTRSQAIVVLEARGSWSKIRYIDEGSKEMREGWAASGYLVQIEC